MRRLPGPDPEGFGRPIKIETAQKGGVRLSDAAADYTAMPEEPEKLHFQSGPGNNAPTLVPPPNSNDPAE